MPLEIARRLLLLGTKEDMRSAVADLPPSSRLAVRAALEELTRTGSSAERALAAIVLAAVEDLFVFAPATRVGTRSVRIDVPTLRARLARRRGDVDSEVSARAGIVERLDSDTPPAERWAARWALARTLREQARYDEALSQLEGDMDALSDEDVARMRILGGALLADLGRHEWAESEYELALQSATAAQRRRLQLAAMAGVRAALHDRGHHAEAVRRSTTMLLSVENWGRPEATAEAELGLAHGFVDLGDPERARRHLPARTAVTSSQLWLRLGEVHERLGDPTAAVDCFRLALAHGGPSMLAESAARLGAVEPLDATGVAAIRGALIAARRGGAVHRELRLAILASRALVRAGEADAAVRELRQTLERTAWLTPRAARLMHVKAELASLLGPEEAAPLLLEVVDGANALLEEAGLDRRRAEIVSEWFGVYEALVNRQGAEPAVAFDLHEAAKSRSFAAGLADAELDPPSQVGEYLHSREAGLLAQERELQDWGEWGEPQQAQARIRKLSKVQAELRRTWDEMAPLAPNYVRLRHGAPANVAAARRLLRDFARAQTALVSYFCGERDTTIFVVRPDTPEPLVFHVARGRAELAEAADLLRRRINGDRTRFPVEPRIRGARPDRTDLSPVFDLGPDLLCFRPALDGIELVCIAPHGPLHLLPLHALAGRDGTRLIEAHGVVYTPSLSALELLLERASASSGSPSTAYVAGVGSIDDDPALFEHDDVLLERDRWLVTADMGPRRAGKARVRRQLGRHDVAHVVCHGYFSAKRPMDSGLVLSNGHTRPPGETLGPADRRDFVLSSRELLEDSFAVQLIALRACSTGLSAPRERGDELDGLSRALLYAGARALVASLWNVDQESSQALFARFYHHWNRAGGGMEKWRALALAQREMLSGDDHPVWRHPYHWAPLILVGDWS